MVVNGWYTCPTCHRKLQKVPEDAVMYGVPVYCSKCKIEWFPAFFNGREIDDDEPFPVHGSEDMPL